MKTSFSKRIESVKDERSIGRNRLLTKALLPAIAMSLSIMHVPGIAAERKSPPDRKAIEELKRNKLEENDSDRISPEKREEMEKEGRVLREKKNFEKEKEAINKRADRALERIEGRRGNNSDRVEKLKKGIMEKRDRDIERLEDSHSKRLSLIERIGKRGMELNGKTGPMPEKELKKPPIGEMMNGIGRIRTPPMRKERINRHPPTRPKEPPRLFEDRFGRGPMKGHFRGPNSFR